MTASERARAHAKQVADLVKALENLAEVFAKLHADHARWGDYRVAIDAIAKARGGQ